MTTKFRTEPSHDSDKLAGLRGWRLGWLSFVVACGPAVIVGDGDSSAGKADTSTGGGPTTTMPGTGNPTGPGTTPGPSAEVTTVDPQPTGGTESTSDDTSVTTTPSTAGEDGGTPGGAGSGGTPDEPGDVDLPEADVLAAAVYTDGTMVDFRVQLAKPPFDVEASYGITWCIASGDGDGSCAMHADDIDNYLEFGLTAGGDFVSGTRGVDACLHGAFESETSTLRVLVPVETFPGTSDFRWILSVTFGGSFGDNEWVPDNGALDVLVVDELPPFSGEPTCG